MCNFFILFILNIIFTVTKLHYGQKKYYRYVTEIIEKLQFYSYNILR